MYYGRSRARTSTDVLCAHVPNRVYLLCPRGGRGPSTSAQRAAGRQPRNSLHGCVTCRCGPSASRALSTNLLIGLRSLLVVPQLVSRIVKLPSTSAASVTCTDTYLTCTCRCRRLDAAMAWLSRIQFNLLETKLPPLDSRFKDFCANEISIGR